jgi:hypothetical protein
MTHTPTPWDYYENDGEPAIVTNDGTWRGTVAKVELSEDAAFIVRACNAHDALVEALEMARSRIQWLAVEEVRRNSNPNMPHKVTDRQNDLANIDAALKLARGE